MCMALNYTIISKLKQTISEISDKIEIFPFKKF